MSGFLGLGSSNASTPLAVLGYHVQTAVFGTPIPILLGTDRCAGNVLWVGDWDTNATNPNNGSKGANGTSGKGSGGGKGGGQYQYSASFILGLCQGPCIQVFSVWQDKTQVTTVELENTAFGPGDQGQGLWGFLLSNHYGQALGYSEICYYAFQNSYLGTSATIPNYSFEVQGPACFTPFGWIDAVVSDAIWYILANFNCMNFPQSYVGNLTMLRSYCLANNLNVSPNLNSQDTAQTALQELLLVCNADAFWSEGQIKCVTYGDTSAATSYNPSGGWGSGAVGTCNLSGGGVGSVIITSGGEYIIPPVLTFTGGTGSGAVGYCLLQNGVGLQPVITVVITTPGSYSVAPTPVFTAQSGVGVVAFTPNLTPVFNLTYDDFIADSGKNPIVFTIEAIEDASNLVYYEYANRGRQYNLETVSAQDLDAVAKYGLNVGSVQTIHSVKNANVANLVSQVQLKRGLYMLRHAQFTLGWSKSVLEPMDLVTVPEVQSGTTVGVRILKIEEDDKGNLACEGEVLPFPILNAVLNPAQISGGYTPGYGANPGTTIPPIFFETPPGLSNVNFAKHLYLLIALSGGPNWGGCAVYVSTDGGNSYNLAGTQQTPANMGFSTGVLPWSVDPDATDTLAVNLQPSLGELFTVSKQTADAFKSLILLDDELMSYETATLTGSNEYNITYLRRGVYSTFAVPHASNAPFTVVDDNLFQFMLNPSDVGKTFFFKFPAYNKAGQQTQSLADAVAYPYTINNGVTRLPLPLQPYTAFILTNTGYFEGAGPGMRMQQVNVNNSDGSVSTGMQVQLTPPANTATTLINTSPFSVAASSGGSIVAGTYLVALCGVDTNGNLTDFILQTVVVSIGSSTITLTPTWATGTVGYEAWIGLDIDQLALVSQNLSSTPSTIAITATTPTQPPGGVFAGVQYTGEPLDRVYDHTQLTAYAISHGGLWGDVNSAYGSSTITFAGANFTVNQFAPVSGQKYKLKLYAIAEGGSFPFIPILEVGVISNTAGPGSVLTLDTDLTPFVSSGILSAGGGDVWVMRMLPQSITATGFSDPNFVNSYAPSGLRVNQDAQNVLVAIEGTGAGEIFNYIASNTATGFTIQGKFAVTPDATTVFAVLYPLPFPPSATPSISTTGIGLVTSTGLIHIGGHAIATYPNFAPLGTISTPNQEGLSILVVAQASDSLGNLAVFGLSPMQEAWVWGQPGTGASSTPSYYVITPSTGNATIDFANAGSGTPPGLTQDLVLNGTAVTILAPIYTGGSIVAGMSFTLYLDEDATGGRAAPTFTGGSGGFASTVGAQLTISGIANTRTIAVFSFDGTYWSLNSQSTGGPV